MWKISSVFGEALKNCREIKWPLDINSVPSKSKIEVTLISVAQFTNVHKCSRPLFETHCRHHGQIRNFETQNRYCLRAIRNSTQTDAKAQWSFLETFVQKVIVTNLNSRHQRSTKMKIKGNFVMSILKVLLIMHLLFQVSYLLVPKIEICLKYFLDKNPKQRPLWWWG